MSETSFAQSTVDVEAVRALARRQFGAVAAAYAESPAHAAGTSLARMLELAPPDPEDTVLDVATGAGHAALAYAPHVSAVVASDITPEMLEQVRRLAAERGLSNVETCGDAPAEALPFPDVAFEKVLCRVAPHHFPEVTRFVAESYRVLKPGGALVLCDTISPDDDPETGAWLDRMERLRDPSHFRDWSPAEWRAMATAAGFAVEAVDTTSCRSEQFFDSWAARMRCSEATVAALLELFAAAPPAARAFVGMTALPDARRYSFYFPQIVAVFRRAGDTRTLQPQMDTDEHG
jgi:ubiquinone/menaquinone biosynthesis C-methylase UbiE